MLFAGTRVPDCIARPSWAAVMVVQPRALSAWTSRANAEVGTHRSG